MSTVIKVENLSKEYRLGSIGHGYLFRDLQSTFAKLRGKEDPNAKVHEKTASTKGRFMALDDVSFEVKQGEVLGIIGRNGAGKSTLLKILSRVTTPTQGSIKVKGRIASLLEVGTGFHPELTGRENIFLNGAILGMSKAEVKAKFDEIVDFAGVEQFIDTPVKRYSSGMYVRLAFAVAAHLESEILIVDEVLAVGDAEFQKKCLGKMEEVSKGQGRTVLFVSHNMGAVRNLCRSSISLNSGRLFDIGESQKVIDNYLTLYLNNSVPDFSLRTDRTGDGSIRFTKISIGTQGTYNNSWVNGKNCNLRLIYEETIGKKCKNIEIAVVIKKTDQTPMLYIGTKILQKNRSELIGQGTSTCEINKMPLEPGKYLIGIEIKNNGIIVDYIANAYTVDVFDGDFYGTGQLWEYGGFLCQYNWSHE